MDRLAMTRPDDFHVHLREGDHLRSAVNHSARVFGRVLAMPNLKPPIRNTDLALRYGAWITQYAKEANPEFRPLLTLYLTDDTTADTILTARRATDIVAAKLYPANATTNSADGVTDIGRMCDVFATMENWGMVLSIHGEMLSVGDKEIDVFDREKTFIEKTLPWIVDSFPRLKVVLEHITTQEAVAFVESSRDGVAATITAHHLLENRNAIFRGGIRPHYYCLPILKREADREALLLAATGGNPKFFLGTDSAPHPLTAKQSDCGCAGCFTSPAAIEWYAEAFDSIDALDRLEGFASRFGCAFYGLPPNEGTVTLVREDWTMPDKFIFGSPFDWVVPFRAGQTVRWKITA